MKPDCGTCVDSHRAPNAPACASGCRTDPERPNWYPKAMSLAPRQQEQTIQDPALRDRLTPRPSDEQPVRGLRFNSGKRRFDLIPPDTLAALADLLTVGAQKYAERNWELGMPYKDAIASLERHLNAWKAGEDNDPETGLSHMVHVMCNAMFLATWEHRGVGTDDRVKCGLPDAPTPTLAR